MSDAASFALTLPRDRQTAARARPIDLNATYRFSYVRERWLTGAGKMVHSLLMIAAGVFLLTQVSSTPNLAVQITIVGVLLAGGSLVLLSRSYADIFGGVTVDRQGVRATQIWSQLNVAWPEVTRWRVNENAAKIVDLSGVEIWTKKSEFPHVIPGGFLPENDYHQLRHLLFAFAEGRESA